jgi:hypothetical protein
MLRKNHLECERGGKPGESLHMDFDKLDFCTISLCPLVVYKVSPDVSSWVLPQ